MLSLNVRAQEPQVSDSWAGARWIAYENLPDSMKVVPGVHGNGNQLGDKCLKTAVVPLFRKDFTISGDIDSAAISICGLGQYVLHVNGQKIGDRFLSPGWSLYQKKCFYNTFDLTGYLRKGQNTLGVIVGPGFYYISRERYRKLVEAYGYPRLIFHVTIWHSDGTTQTIVSDRDCRVSPSAVTFSSIYGGEDFDARLAQQGWDSPGFSDSLWSGPVVLSGFAPRLIHEDDFPVKVMEVFPTRGIHLSRTGRTVYDFGQNTSGIVSLKVKGNPGARIRILPGELTDSLGNVTQRSSGSPYEFNYTLLGSGTETWEPLFSYYGFRYADVEIIEPEGRGESTKVEDLRLLHTRNSAPAVGAFRCSDTLFNRIFDLINWGIRSNMASVATDCPHREKLGWLEQTYLIGPSMHFNYDIHSFYAKIIGDMMDSQLSNGLVPDIAPEYVHFKDGFRDSPEWGSASVVIPYQLFRWYGDTAILRSAYPMMKAYVNYLSGKAVNGILDYGLGDWYDLGPKPPGEAQLTPKGVTATSVFYFDLEIMEKAARLLGAENDRETFATLAGDVRRAFLKKYVNLQTGLCATGSQTSYAMPLYVGIIPEAYRKQVLKNLVDSIRANDYALTAGDIGYRFLVGTLSENGRSDVLFLMNNRTDRPGYGYQLMKGATALTESWSALPTSSNDHMMLGHLMEWFYDGLGGISQSDSSTAYHDIVIAPKPAGHIRWAKCSYRSPAGLISTDWKAEEKKFIMDFIIPEGSFATLILPDAYGRSIRLTGLTGNKVSYTKLSPGRYRIKGGSYRVTAFR